jgi:hypothetical protein
MGIGKMIIGLALVLGGLWALVPDYGLGLYGYLWDVLLGVVPALVVFLGAILVWIEWEEMRVEKPKKKR